MQMFHKDNPSKTNFGANRQRFTVFRHVAAILSLSVLALSLQNSAFAKARQVKSADEPLQQNGELLSAAIGDIDAEKPSAMRELALVPVPKQTQEEADIKKRQAALEKQFAKGDYQKAELVAARVVTAMETAFGETDIRLVPAIVNLATSQYHRDDIANAIANFQRAVRITETSGNFRDPRLASPLSGLGVSFYKAGLYAEAIEALERAAFISRAHAGLQATEQLANDNVLMRSFLASGRVEEASDRQKVHLQIMEQAAVEGPELESARLEAAKWFRLMGDYREEIKIHEKRAKDQREKTSRNDPSLVPIYQDLALAYRRQLERDLPRLKLVMNRTENDHRSLRGYAISGGVRPFDDFTSPFDQEMLDNERETVSLLRRTMKIQKRDKSARPEDKVKTWILMGDHKTVTGEARRGFRYYEKAYELLKKEKRQDLIDLYFGGPVAIYKPRVSPPNTKDPVVLAAFTGQAELEMDVNRVGNSYNVSVLSISPDKAKFLEKRILYSARNMVFRPRFTEKGAISTKNHKYVYKLQPALHEQNLNPNQVEINAY